MALPVKILGPKGKAPTRGSVNAAGYDLYSAESIMICPGDKVTISTQIAVAIPAGYYGRVAPRSGLAAKYDIDVMAGVIDADYRGEIKVILISHAKGLLYTAYNISPGDRIAQLIIEKIATPEVAVVDELPETDRGAGGFGSTGK